MNNNNLHRSEDTMESILKELMDETELCVTASFKTASEQFLQSKDCKMAYTMTIL